MVLVGLRSEWRLGVLMLDRGINDHELAKRLGKLTGGKALHPDTVADWRRSRTKPNMFSKYWQALPKALDCKPEELWTPPQPEEELLAG